MGNCCDICNRYRNRQKNITILLTGLDNAGKTTIAKKLAGESVDSILPTVGFSLIVLHHYGYKISVYDLGGGPQIRDIWNKYFTDAHGIIYVTDASDMTRLGESKIVLADLLAHVNVSEKPILLLANKQDKENALDEIDIVEQLDVEHVVNKYRCPTRVEICSAYTPDTMKIDKGIKSGFRWLIDYVIQNYRNLDERVRCDMQEYLTLLEKRREEWRRKIESNENERFENGDATHENGSPFKPIETVVNNMDNNDRQKLIGANRRNVLVDNFMQDQPACSSNEQIDKSSTTTITRLALSRKEKLKKLRNRYRKKFGRFNKTAPMPMELLSTEMPTSTVKMRFDSGQSTNSCLSYGFERKSKRARLLSSLRRPATAPPKINFSSLKVKTVIWNLDVLSQIPATSCPKRSDLADEISHI